MPIAAAFSLHDLVPLAQVAGCVLGAEFVVSEYIKQQVAQGVRLRCGEPRSVDWTAERELQEFTDQLMETRVPHSEMVVRRCEAAEKGFGLFTTVPITSGAFIAEYTGRVYKGDDHGSVPLDGACTQRCSYPAALSCTQLTRTFPVPVLISPPLAVTTPLLEPHNLQMRSALVAPEVIRSMWMVPTQAQASHVS